MRKVFLSTLAVLLFSALSFAQGQIDVNPNVQWRFVRSNDVKLVTGNLQTFEFPAYRNHNYIVNLEMRSDTVDVEIYVYDMQSKLISEKKVKASQTAQLEFGVFNNATYQVAVRVKSPSGELKEVNTLMSLLKRPKF